MFLELSVAGIPKEKQFCFLVFSRLTKMEELLTYIREIQNGVCIKQANESSSYGPDFTKTITSHEARIFVRLPKLLSDKNGIFSCNEGWRPSANVFSKQDDLHPNVSSIHMKIVKTPSAVKIGNDNLYCNAGIHETFVSRLVTQELSTTPYFSANFVSVKLESATAKRKRRQQPEKQFVLNFKKISIACEPAELLQVFDKRESERGGSVGEAVGLVTHAMWLAQRCLGLKHMDLHVDNVLWRPAPLGITRIVLVHWIAQNVHYGLRLPKNEMGTYMLPSIIDYGLSSARWKDVNIRRIDYAMLESYNHPKTWGRFSQTLVDDEAYDITTYVESLTREATYARPLLRQTLEELDTVHRLLGHPKLSKNGRPRGKATTSMKKLLHDLLCAGIGTKIGNEGLLQSDMMLDFSGKTIDSHTDGQEVEPPSRTLLVSSNYDSSPESCIDEEQSEEDEEDSMHFDDSSCESE